MVLREPAKELVAVPVREMDGPPKMPPVVTLPVAWMPLLVLMLPAVKEEEAPWTRRLPPILA